MDFTLSREHLMLQEMYRSFTENEVSPLAQEVDEEERFQVLCVAEFIILDYAPFIKFDIKPFRIFRVFRRQIKTGDYFRC